MSDKKVYASHGTYIKCLSSVGMVRWNKPKSGIINPLPENKPERRRVQEHSQLSVESKQFPIKFKFQQRSMNRVIPEQLKQPFLYIEKLIPKNTAQRTPMKSNKQPISLPEGYSNLYSYEKDKQQSASLLFSRLLKVDVVDLKQVYLSEQRSSNEHMKDSNCYITVVTQDSFISFMNKILASKLTNRQLKHFFKLYSIKGTEPQKISIKALCYNYQKYRKKQTEIVQIISKKAAKDRYLYVRQYFIKFNSQYNELKQAMLSIKGYQQSLRRYLQNLYDNYQNPYASEISTLQEQLQLPITKYNPPRKQQLQKQIQKLQNDNNELHSNITHQYENFIKIYEEAIITTHDLFFTKRTVSKLLLPLLHKYSYLDRSIIENSINSLQIEKEEYLQCLSEVIVQIERDKKILGQNYFTLAEIVNLVLMRNKIPNQSQFSVQFTINALKKLIKQIKRQFLIKFNITIDNFDNFVPQQQIPLPLLRLCFEMQCTRVLFQNQIWSQLFSMLPSIDIKTNHHQHTMQINSCLQCIKKYTCKLDEKINIQLQKSKHVSLLAESANLNNFGSLTRVVEEVMQGIDEYCPSQQEQVTSEKKRVVFADVVQEQMQKSRNEQTNLLMGSILKNNGQNQSIMAKSILNSIHGYQQVQTYKSTEHENPQLTGNLNHIKTLAKSFFIPDALNTNAFDIRYYERLKNEQEQPKEQVVRMGNSILLSNLPQITEIESKDPLKISGLLLKSINNKAQEEKKVITRKTIDSNIKEGVDHHYFRQKIKLQNKRTIFDAQGKSKYSVMMPTSYYQGYLAEEAHDQDRQQWYLRAHHVETNTQNPLSKKDNLLRTEYHSKFPKMELKKRQEEFKIEANVSRKQGLIQSLEQTIANLKNEINEVKKPTKAKTGATVPTAVLNQYLTKITEDKQDKDLQLAAYEGVLYDLRRKQRNLLNEYRTNQNNMQGYPTNKWWQGKDKHFHNELKKQRMLVTDSFKPEQSHNKYVSKLQNQEIF